jgi:ABC-2 type transport system permease protein
VDKLIAIIRREYLSRVRSKWFIVTTLLAPVLLVGAMLLPVLLAVRQAERDIEISIVDESGLITQELLATGAFEEGRVKYRPPPARETPDETLAALRQQVNDRELSGYLYIPGDVLNGGDIQFWGRDVGQTLLRSTLSPAINTAVRRVQARRLGLTPEAAAKLTRAVPVEMYRLTDGGAAREEQNTVLAAHILALAIYMVVLLYGAMMLRAAVAEKSSKMVEIILSSVRPWQLMLGKILGVGAVGLTQIGVWLSLIVVFLLYAGTAQAFSDVEFLKDLPVGFDTLALFVGLFITGYFVYAGMYASVGAIASTEQEASQLQLPVTLLVIIPILVIPIVLEAPTSTTAMALSWVPFFMPVLLIARYVLGAVSPWEIPLAFALQIVTILAIAWVGGRIYRIGLLMTGKRPTIPELLRWVRHG